MVVRGYKPKDSTLRGGPFVVSFLRNGVLSMACEILCIFFFVRKNENGSKSCFIT